MNSYLNTPWYPYQLQPIEPWAPQPDPLDPYNPHQPRPMKPYVPRPYPPRRNPFVPEPIPSCAAHESRQLDTYGASIRKLPLYRQIYYIRGTKHLAQVAVSAHFSHTSTKSLQLIFSQFIYRLVLPPQ